jgi:hypothetical protein
MAYTFQEIGARAKQRNPSLSKFSDEEVGKRISERNPEVAKLVSPEQAAASSSPSPEAVTVPPAEPQKGLGRKAADVLTGGTQAFAKTIGVANATGAQNTINKSSVAEADANLKMAKLLNRPGTTPEQKARIRAQLAQGTNIGTAAEVLPDLQKTNRQVYGEGLGFGLEAAAGGALSGVAKARTLLGAAGQAAGSGAAYGGLGGTSSAMRENKGVADTAKSAATGAVVGGVVGGTVGLAGRAVSDRLANRAAASQDKVDRAVGQIAQSKTGDVAQHKRALMEIGKEELGEVSTYDDLRGAVRDRLNALRKNQDAALASAPEAKPLDSFTKRTGAGKSEVTSNPVTKALDDMEELYEKTSDPESLSAHLALREKAETVGLTASEVNQLARDYGSEFGSKAFSLKSGDPLTSVNAQSFENTRKAVKDAARELLPDDASKAMDASMSDLLELDRSVAQVNEKVNALKNKIKERGLGERIGRLLGQAFDVASFGTGKGFVTKAFFPSGVGEKMLNYLDIQKQLPKNIKMLTAALNADDDKLARFVASLFGRSEKAAEKGGAGIGVPKAP